jgi:anti-anti-sigma factor
MLEDTLNITSSPIAERPGCFLLTLEGDLDSSNATGLAQLIKDLCDKEGLVHLVMDFSKLRYINSTGLGTILKISKTLATLGGSFKIASPDENVFEVIEIVGASKLLNVYQTKEEALASLKC